MFDEFGFIDAFGGGGADISPIAFDTGSIADTAWTPSFDSSLFSPDMAMGGATGGFDQVGPIVNALADAGRFDLIPPFLESAGFDTAGFEGMGGTDPLAPLANSTAEAMPPTLAADPSPVPSLMSLMTQTPEAPAWLAPWNPMGDLGQSQPMQTPLIINPEQQFGVDALSGFERGIQPPQELGLGAANAFEFGSQPPPMGAQSFDESGFSLPPMGHNDGGPMGSQGVTEQQPDFSWVFGGQPEIPSASPSSIINDHFKGYEPLSGAQSFDEGGFSPQPLGHSDGGAPGMVAGLSDGPETSLPFQQEQVPLPMPRPYAYDNANAIRSHPVTHTLESRIADTATNVYGPGSRGVIYSGGQEKPFKDPFTGKMSSTRHNLDAEGRGQAADVKFYDPQGNLVSNPAAAGQYWASQGWGGAAPGMRGGGIHLDQHTDKAPTWTYPGTTPDQRAAVQRGIAGQAPKLAYAPERQMADVKEANKDFAPNASNDPAKPMERYKNAIGQMESGNRYDKIGPDVVRKDGTVDNAYGRYGVMGSNVSAWTKAHVGKAMTPAQFLADEKAQDKVFEGQFGKYVQKHGPEGAAKAWLAGETGMKNPNDKDQLGTTTTKYAEKFTKLAGAPPLEATTIPQGATPTEGRTRVADATGQRTMTDVPPILGGLFGGGQGGGMPAIMGGQGSGMRNPFNDPGSLAAMELIVNSLSRAAPIHGLAESARHDQRYAEQQMGRQAAEAVLIQMGYSPQEARAYSYNPAAVEMLQKHRQQQSDQSAYQQFSTDVLGGGQAPRTQPAPQQSPSMLSPAPMAQTQSIGQPQQQGAPAIKGAPPLPASTRTMGPSPQKILEFINKNGSRLSPEARKMYMGLYEKSLEAYKPTGTQSDYRAYYEQEMAGGRAPLTFRDWDMQNRGAGASKVTVNTGEQGDVAFDKEFGKANAERYGEYIKQGDVAKGRMSDIGILRDASRNLGSQGVAANVKATFGPYLEAAGVDINGLSDIQTWESVTKRIAPTMRVAGSGSTSDIEYKGMLQAVGPLSNNPAAREAILDTFEAGSRNEIERGRIASMLATKEITRKEAEEMIRALPDPMTAFREWRKDNSDVYSEAVKHGKATPEAKSGGKKGEPAPSGPPKNFDKMPVNDQLNWLQRNAPEGTEFTIKETGNKYIIRDGKAVPVKKDNK